MQTSLNKAMSPNGQTSLHVAKQFISFFCLRSSFYFSVDLLDE
jgi:hypothetical protein